MHLDALCAEPRAWLLAVWWRLCGKRLRARAIMAPLIGGSRWAYRLWLAQGGAGAAEAKLLSDSEIVIVALVATGEDQERTLSSLADEGIPARLLARGAAPDGRDAEWSSGAKKWVMLLAAGDVLAPGAGTSYRTAATLADEGVHVLYADDDILGAGGRRDNPHFKPDWNSELYRHFDYVTGASILRAQSGDLDGLSAKNWAEELTERVIARGSAQGCTPVHLRQILHHRRARPLPHRPGNTALPAEGQGQLPPVSVIIPTRNRLDLLRPCLEGLASTTYPAPVEIIVIDNDSDDPETVEYLAGLDPTFAKVLHHPGPFNFAAMNNRAVSQATGDLLCFLNNDIEIRDPNWLAIMARQAMRDDVGAVGACLLYPDGRIQHAGVVIGVGGGAAHAHRLLRPEEEGYFHRHALPQFLSAVTAACLVVRREKFLAVDGFDAENFAVAFNDVDLCLKLNAKGWQTFYEPRAMLIHHESVSRGLDRDPAGAARLAAELAALKERWHTSGENGLVAQHWQAVDPFHHKSLSPFSERFVVRL